MKKYFALFLILIIVSGCKERSNNPDKSAKEIIELSGSKDQFKLFLDAFLKNFPERRANAIKGIVDVNEFCDRMIPLYKKHFSIEEMQDLIDFYNSDTGQKLVRLNPTLFKEGSEIGTQYFKEKLSAVNYFNDGY